MSQPDCVRPHAPQEWSIKETVTTRRIAEIKAEAKLVLNLPTAIAARRRFSVSSPSFFSGREKTLADSTSARSSPVVGVALSASVAVIFKRDLRAPREGGQTDVSVVFVVSAHTPLRRPNALLYSAYWNYQT
jgi:hypothetical protein